MAFSNYNTNYNGYYAGYPVSFNGQFKLKDKLIRKPVEQVEQVVNNTMDTFVPESQDEETKKSHKTAVKVFSTVLVLSGLVALLNPKFSSKLMKNLEKKSTNAGNNAQVKSRLDGVWNRFKEHSYDALSKTVSVVSNVNNLKDQAFRWICDKTVILKKPNSMITKGFDKISKRTVIINNNDAFQQMNLLKNVIQKYKSRLNPKELELLEKKLKEIEQKQEYFTKENVSNRLLNQENMMSDLQKNEVSKISSYFNGFKDKNIDKKEHAKGIFNFWAEDLMKEQKTKIEAEGREVVNTLVGDGKSQKGLYNEVIDILSPHLKEAEKSVFDDGIKITANTLRNANKSECVEYFDKKRDLMLGSAPTDILTAVLGLAGSGIAIGTADSKEERVSRLVTGVIPVIGGLGVNTLLTSMLFSGGTAIGLGAASSILMSFIGSGINRLLPKQPQVTANKEKPIKEVLDA